MLPTQSFVRFALRNKLVLARYAQKQAGWLERSKVIMSTRSINTTNKNKDHNTIDVFDPEYVNVKKPKGPETPKEFADVAKQKNWISYGFDYVNLKEDRRMTHVFFFAFVTMGCIVICWVGYYFPDPHLADWTLREAFLELERRESQGLPLIDPNYVDPAKIELPSEEELVGVEVKY